MISVILVFRISLIFSIRVIYYLLFYSYTNAKIIKKEKEKHILTSELTQIPIKMIFNSMYHFGIWNNNFLFKRSNINQS